MKDFIAEAEQRLLDAVRNADVETLSELICDRLIFTDHNGHLLTKKNGFGGLQVRRSPHRQDSNQ